MVNADIREDMEQIDDDLAHLEELLFAEEWGQADALTADLNDRWESYQRYWQCFLTHEELSGAETALEELRAAIEARGEADAWLSSLRVMQKDVRHIAAHTRIGPEQLF